MPRLSQCYYCGVASNAPVFSDVTKYPAYEGPSTSCNDGGTGCKNRITDAASCAKILQAFKDKQGCLAISSNSYLCPNKKQLSHLAFVYKVRSALSHGGATHVGGHADGHAGGAPLPYLPRAPRVWRAEVWEGLRDCHCT